jgi:hypothetical protein
MKKRLREKLIGAWRLVPCLERDVDTDALHPSTNAPMKLGGANRTVPLLWRRASLNA